MSRTVVTAILCILAGVLITELIIFLFFRVDLGDFYTPLSFAIICGLLGGCVFQYVNKCYPTSGAQRKVGDYLKPWQFNLIRVLAAIIGLAIVFCCFGVLGRTSSVGVFLSAVILASIVIPHIGKIFLGGCVIFACVWFALFFREYLGPPTDRLPTIDTLTVLIGICLLVPAAILLRVFYSLDMEYLTASLILFEIFLFLFIASITGIHLFLLFIDIFLGTEDFNFVMSWFLIQKWYIAVPWLVGIVIGKFLSNFLSPRGIISNRR